MATHPPNPSQDLSQTQFHPQTTEDGSGTFFSEDFQEAFHSSVGAKTEAYGKFIEPCGLKDLARSQGEITILDVCYGLGYNTAAALEAIWQVNPACRVVVVASELNGAVPRSALDQGLFRDWSPEIQNILREVGERHTSQGDRWDCRLLLGDARQTLPPLNPKSFQADGIFLDPFSPPKCPQLWSQDFLQKITQFLHPQGYLATYSCAAALRSALLNLGLKVGRTEGIGRRSPGTLARWTPENLTPLLPQEIEHLHTRAAIPYRDPGLRDTAETIHQRRRQAQAQSPLESTSQWKKRWWKKSQREQTTDP